MAMCKELQTTAHCPSVSQKQVVSPEGPYWDQYYIVSSWVVGFHRDSGVECTLCKFVYDEKLLRLFD